MSKGQLTSLQMQRYAKGNANRWQSRPVADFLPTKTGRRRWLNNLPRKVTCLKKRTTFTEIGRDVYAFTAEGDPNSGVIIGDESVMVIEAQATPLLARKVIDCIRSVTDRPISHVVLTHYHAVRVLGASAFGASQIIMGSKARSMVAERGQEDWDSEFRRFPRLFLGHEEIPGLTWLPQHSQIRCPSF